ncbi:MAG: hypothetical protein IT379_38150 [Deltaproteobacteria bacterium]|nr:hypothetical protein [Deltaproteobacteria bacterium]
MVYDTGDSTRDAALTRGSNDLHCPVVRAQTVGGGAYRIGGCGRSATYVCVDRMTGGPLCSLDSMDESHARVDGAPIARGSGSLPRPRAQRAPSADAVGVPDPQTAQATRERLTAVAAELTECVGRSPVAIRADVSAQGRLTLAVRDVAPGTPESECVQAVAATIELAPPAAPGRVLHVIRRPDAAP